MSLSPPAVHADTAAPATPPGFWQVARRPRMIGMLIAFLIVAAVCGTLGQWQLSRAVERGNLAKEHEAAELAAVGPTALGELLHPQQSFPGKLVGRSVILTGSFEPEHQVLVPGRVLNGEVGWLVVTALRVSDDGLAGQSWAELSGPPMLPVVRGWVASLPDAERLAPLDPSPAEVVGYLQSSEAATADTVATGQVEMISSGQLVNSWGGPTYSGYLVLAEQTPAGDPAVQVLPRPTIEGGGVNVQNLAYAVQWWIFGFFAVFLWVRMVRDLRADEIPEAHGADPDASPKTRPGASPDLTT